VDYLKTGTSVESEEGEGGLIKLGLRMYLCLYRMEWLGRMYRLGNDLIEGVY
jgi:hypothetical protein